MAADHIEVLREIRKHYEQLNLRGEMTALDAAIAALAQPQAAPAADCSHCWDDRWMKNGTPCPECNASGNRGHNLPTPTAADAPLAEAGEVPLDVRILARDVHYAITDDGLAPLSPADNHKMREAILRVLATRTGGQPAGVGELYAVAAKAWDEHQANCRITTTSGSLRKAIEAVHAAMKGASHDE